MRPFSVLLTAILVAGWVGAIAILSVQNFSLVSLKFLAWESIQIPVGIVLAFAAGIGMVGTAALQLLPSNRLPEDADD
jgi:uncharacterized integral membrane protein